MSRKEDFIGLSSMKIWIAVLLGMTALMVIVYSVMSWTRNHRSLTARVFQDGAFVMSAETPWGISPDELWPKLQWVSSAKMTEDRYQQLVHGTKTAEDGSYEIIPFEIRRYRESKIELTTHYQMSAEGHLISGSFQSEEDDSAAIRPEAAKYVRAICALPVQGDTPEEEILAELEKQDFRGGSWFWQAGDTKLELSVKVTVSSTSKSGYAAILSIRLYGPEAFSQS